MDESSSGCRDGLKFLAFLLRSTGRQDKEVSHAMDHGRYPVLRVS